MSIFKCSPWWQIKLSLKYSQTPIYRHPYLAVMKVCERFPFAQYFYLMPPPPQDKSPKIGVHRQWLYICV